MIGLPSANTVVIACLLIIGGAAGWSARTWKADLDMAAFKDDLAQQTAAQRELKATTEAAQAATTAHSTQRLDEQQAQQIKETVYVEKEVIRYRDRWRDRACQRPADWVRLYNDSLFGPAGAVPATR